jgi:hypothetical protein
MEGHFASLYGVFNPFSTAAGVSWSAVQETSVSAVSWCGLRISDRNSAMSSRPHRSRNSASASLLTDHPVRREYRAAS